MMLNLRGSSIPKELSKKVHQQCYKDLVKRQDIAILYYLVIFGLAAAVVLIPENTPDVETYMLMFGASIIIANWLRRYAINRFKQALGKKHDLPWTLLYSSILIASLVWGVLLATAAAPSPLQVHFPVFLSGILCLASGGILALSIDRMSMYIFGSGILGPTILSLVYGGTSLQIGLALVLVVFGIGMVWLANLNREEYLSFVISDLRLRNHIKELTENSESDWLTGLKNRKYLDKVIPKEVRRAHRLAYPLSAMMIDIDHFKRINDGHGHVIGDEVLKETAELIRSTCQREIDTVARYGGEEFCVLLPGMDDSSALALAENLQKAVSKMQLVIDSKSIRVTVSIGGATLQGQRQFSSDWLIRTADDRLYDAKNNGRNRVVWRSNDREKGDYDDFIGLP